MSNFSVKTEFKAIDKVTSVLKKMSSATSKFGKISHTALQRASMATRKFIDRSNNAMRSIFNLRNAIGLMVVGSAVKHLVGIASGVAKVGDETGKTARMLGISAEYLQEMRFAADRQGVSTETLTKSFMYLNKNMGEFQNGYGTLYTALNKIDPALAQQAKMVRTNKDAFELASKAIAKAPDQLQKAAIAQAFFGRSGQEMLKLLEAGPAGIKALRDEANKLGLVMSTEATRASEKFIDAQTNMNAALKGLTNTIGIALMPKIQLITEKITAWIGANRDLIKAKIHLVVQKLSNMTDKVIRNLPQIVSWIKRIVIAMAAWKAITIAANVVLGITKTLMAVQDTYNFIKAIKWVTAAQKVWTAVQWALNAAMDAFPVIAIIMGIIALVAGIVMLVKHWKTVWEWLNKIFDNKWGKLAMAIFTPLIFVAMLIARNWEKVKAVLSTVWEAIKTGLKAVGLFIFDFLIKPIEFLLSMVAKLPGKVGNLAQSALDGIGTVRVALGGDQPEQQNRSEIINRDAVFQQQQAQQSKAGNVFLNVNNNNNSDISVKSATIPVRINKTSMF